MRIDVTLRHQGKGAAGAGEYGRNDEVDGDDPVGRNTQILDAQIVLSNREAGESELERNRIVAAMPARPVVTIATAYSMKSASRGSVNTMPNRLGRPTLKPSEPPSALVFTSAP